MRAFINSLRELSSLFSGHRTLLAWGVLLSAVQGVTLVPFAWIVREFFEELLAAGRLETLLMLLGFMASLIAINAVLTLWARSVTLRAIKQAIARLRERLLYRIMFTNRSKQSALNISALETSIIQDTERIDCMVSALAVQVLPGGILILGVSAVLLHIHGALFAVVMVVVPLLIVSTRLLHKTMHAHIKKFHTAFGRFGERVSFALRFHDLVAVSGAEQYERMRHSATIQELQNVSRRMAWFATAYNVIHGGSMSLVGIIVLGFGGIQVIRGELSLSELIAFFAALSVLTRAAQTLFSAMPTVFEGIASLASIGRMNGETLDDEGKEVFMGLAREIALESVDFSHGQVPLLRSVSGVFLKGAVTGIVGPSGSGKSTLLCLLTGIHIPQKGRVMIDGKDLRTINLESYRANIGVLLQDPAIFDGTLMENLCFGLPEVSPALLQKAIEVCELDDFIKTLPGGLQTQTHERGGSLSGGQKQKIALARALVREPEILFLDEPDNNLDKEFISRLLGRLKNDRMTIVIVSHTPALQSHYDVTYQCTEQGELKRVNLV